MSGSVPCRSCGQPVPPGRLACPACGTLVASVSSPVVDAAPRLDPDPEAEPAVEPGPAVEPEPMPDEVMASEPEVAPEAAPDDTPEPRPDLHAASDVDVDGDATALGNASPDLESTADDEAALDGETAADSEAEAEGEADPVWPAAAPLEAWAPRTAPLATPQAPPQFQPDEETVVAAAAGDGLGSGGIVPGAYLPPSSVHRPAAPTGEAPAPAAASAWPGPGISSRPTQSPPGQVGSWVPPTPAPGLGAGTSVPSAATPASKPLVPGRSSILADLPFDAPNELEGWLVALGSVVAIIGFFLPWTASLGSGFQGYFGSWGLGIVSHLPVFIFLVIVTALTILPNRVASWVRTGVCGMVGGGILFGITWLYLGSDASQLGALLAAVGAVLLIVGGIIAVAPGRAARAREGG